MDRGTNHIVHCVGRTGTRVSNKRRISYHHKFYFILLIREEQNNQILDETNDVSRNIYNEKYKRNKTKRNTTLTFINFSVNG